MTDPIKININITRKPPPPPLAPFTCVICHRETERDRYQPEWNAPPICVECTFKTATKPRLTYDSAQNWRQYMKIHALILAIEQEVKHARKC